MDNVERSSAFELLRIIAMIMVVLGHCVLATAENTEPYLCEIDNIGWFVKAFTIVAVNCFFLISGYFAKSGIIRIKKITGIWGKTIFYSFTIYFIISIINGNFNIKTSIRYLFPVMLGHYWYIQVYIVLALLTPFIVSMMEKLEKKQFLYLLLILVVFFSIHETFVPVNHTLDRTQGYGIVWAVVMLIIGKWLNLYGKEYVKKIPMLVFLFLYVFIALCIFISNVLIVKYNIAGGVESRGNFYAYNSFSVLIESLCIFCFFIRLSERMKNNRIINCISKNTLSVYLISAHPLLLCSLWKDVFHMYNYSINPYKFILFANVFSFCVFIVCIIIDKINGAIISFRK